MDVRIFSSQLARKYRHGELELLNNKGVDEPEQEISPPQQNQKNPSKWAEVGFFFGDALNDERLSFI